MRFFTELTKKVDKPTTQDAYVYSLVALADVKLQLKELDEARKDLDKAESILDTFDSVETEVHAAFYRTNARYYQVGHYSSNTYLSNAYKSRPSLSLLHSIETHCFILPVSI